MSITTNRDWLNGLDDEEFMEEMLKRKCEHCVYDLNKCEKYCKAGFKGWLQKEYSEPLKPCPICRGEAEIISDVIECENTYAIVCKNCGCSLGIKNIEGNYVPSAVSISKLKSDWNNRICE